ncbi:hypothetical protein T06_15556 [Trichinella sp. T6]|nr:hypothetical protein T06_15556 [Trichinella sp. T6]
MPSYEHNSTDIEKAELLTSKDTQFYDCTCSKLIMELNIDSNDPLGYFDDLIYKLISHLENTTKNKNERECHGMILIATLKFLFLYASVSKIDEL